MKKFFKFLGRLILLLVGGYILGMFVEGFFPSQIATCCQILTGCHRRIASWAPFMGTICDNIEIAWNWVRQFLPYFGNMCGVLITLLLIKWSTKRRFF